MDDIVIVVVFAGAYGCWSSFLLTGDGELFGGQAVVILSIEGDGVFAIFVEDIALIINDDQHVAIAHLVVFVLKAADAACKDTFGGAAWFVDGDGGEVPVQHVRFLR